MDANFSFIGRNIVARIELSDLSVSDRRHMFKCLLRDKDIVTEKDGSEAAHALFAAVEHACKW